MYRKLSKIFIGTVFIGSCFLIALVSSHGMMLDPPGRASRWRFDDSAPVNNDDDGLYCGGISVQWDDNGGKCGLCGDSYSDPTPRQHEFGGEFGQGVIVKQYKSGDIAKIGVLLTANHLGTFKWDICNMDDEKESDECFSKHKITLENGKSEYELHSHKSGWYNVTVKIPDNLQCKHCVLRWTYRAANNWNFCDGDDGYGRLGCGPQEHFRSCADISIYS